MSVLHVNIRFEPVAGMVYDGESAALGDSLDAALKIVFAPGESLPEIGEKAVDMGLCEHGGVHFDSVAQVGHSAAAVFVGAVEYRAVFFVGEPGRLFDNGCDREQRHAPRL